MTDILQGEVVRLRVYDISSGVAGIWSPVLLGKKIEGVWHSGVEVFGYEYFYGGGIVKMRPENVEATFGISPSEVHELGRTQLTRVQFEKHLLSIMPMFRREVYDIIRWNCNTFSDHCCQFLLGGQHIPDYILDLPKEICKTFMGKIIVNFIKMMQGGAAPIAVDDPEHPSRAAFGGQERMRRNSCPASPTSTPATAIDLTKCLETAAMEGAHCMAGHQQKARNPAVWNQRMAERRRSVAPPRKVRLVEPAAEESENVVLLPIRGGMIGDVETEVSYSPTHRKLYELEISRAPRTVRRARANSMRPMSERSARRASAGEALLI